VIPRYGSLERPIDIGKARQIYSDVDNEAPRPKEMVSRKSGRDPGNAVKVTNRQEGYAGEHQMEQDVEENVKHVRPVEDD
jgi:hypothetical protein